MSPIRDGGNRASDALGKPALAKRVDAETPPGDDFTYAVIPTSHPSKTDAERRGASRQRTRLRSGKLVGLDGQFLCECLVQNRSPSGCRLKLAQGGATIPPGLYYYDDQTELLFHARVIWRKEREVGLRLAPCGSSALHRSILGAMRRKFYALRR